MSKPEDKTLRQQLIDLCKQSIEHLQKAEKGKLSKNSENTSNSNLGPMTNISPSLTMGEESSAKMKKNVYRGYGSGVAGMSAQKMGGGVAGGGAMRMSEDATCDKCGTPLEDVVGKKLGGFCEDCLHKNTFLPGDFMASESMGKAEHVIGFTRSGKVINDVDAPPNADFKPHEHHTAYKLHQHLARKERSADYPDTDKALAHEQRARIHKEQWLKAKPITKAEDDIAAPGAVLPGDKPSKDESPKKSGSGGDVINKAAPAMSTPKPPAAPKPPSAGAGMAKARIDEGKGIEGKVAARRARNMRFGVADPDEGEHTVGVPLEQRGVHHQHGGIISGLGRLQIERARAWQSKIHPKLPKDVEKAAPSMKVPAAGGVKAQPQKKRPGSGLMVGFSSTMVGSAAPAAGGMAKARIDEGKSPDAKVSARRERNFRAAAGHLDSPRGMRIVGVPKPQQGIHRDFGEAAAEFAAGKKYPELKNFKLEKVSPPGKFKDLPEKLKAKGYPAKSAFAIAWAAKNKANKSEMAKAEGEGVLPGDKPSKDATPKGSGSGGELVKSSQPVSRKKIKAINAQDRLFNYSEKAHKTNLAQDHATAALMGLSAAKAHKDVGDEVGVSEALSLAQAHVHAHGKHANADKKLQSKLEGAFDKQARGYGYLMGKAEEEKYRLHQAGRRPGSVQYVSHLPGQGGSDWGWTDEPSKALHVSKAWANRFLKDRAYVGAIASAHRVNKLMGKAEHDFGHAPEGQAARVEDAVNQIYQGLAHVHYHKPHMGGHLWEARLHSNTGPKIWALVHPNEVHLKHTGTGEEDVVAKAEGGPTGAPKAPQKMGTATSVSKPAKTSAPKPSMPPGSHLGLPRTISLTSIFKRESLAKKAFGMKELAEAKAKMGMPGQKMVMDKLATMGPKPPKPTATQAARAGIKASFGKAERPESDHPFHTGKTSIGLMSADNPYEKDVDMGGHEALLQDLNRLGLKHEEVKGVYGGKPERSVMIYGPSREQMFHLGEKYGQESVIHRPERWTTTSNPQAHFIYTAGPDKGKYHIGRGQTIVVPKGGRSPFKDNYTIVPGLGHLQMGFNFEDLHGTGHGMPETKKAEPKLPGMTAPKETPKSLVHGLTRTAGTTPRQSTASMVGELVQGAKPKETAKGLVHGLTSKVLGKEEIGFKKLKQKLAHKKGVSDPAAVAAAIGRKKYGQAEMTARSKEGKKS